VKKKFDDILDKLDLIIIKSKERSETIMIAVDVPPVKENDSIVVRKIKEKLNASNGRASIPLYSGKLCEISYDPKGKGLVSPKIPLNN
jgi:hypothetical protein